MTWKRTKEEVPQETAPYLCILAPKPAALKDKDVNPQQLITGPDERLFMMCQYYNGDDGYFHHRLVYYEVTYWMALPPIPEPIIEEEE